MENSVLKKLMYDRIFFYSLTMILLQAFCPQVFAKTKPILSDIIFINKKYQNTIQLWSTKAHSLITKDGQIAYHIVKIDSLINLGARYYHIGEYPKSIRYYREAIKIARLHHEVTKEAQAMAEISTPLITIDYHIEAMHYLDKAWDIENKTDRIKALIIYNTGIVHYYQSMNEEAMIKYKACMAIYNATGDYSEMTFVLASIGHIYLQNHQYKQAEIYYNSSLKYAIQFKNLKAIANAFTSLGNFNSEIGQQDMAIRYYLKAKKILENLGEKTDYLRLLDKMAHTYWKQKKKKKAMYHAKLSYKMATTQKRPYYIFTSAALLGELYEQMNQAQCALDYYKISKMVQDKHHEDPIKEKLVHLNEKFFFNHREQKIKMAHQKHLDKKETQIYIAGISVLFLTIILTLLLIYIKLKKKLNRKLQLAKKEIETQNNSLKKANTFNKQLLSVMAHDIRTPIANVKMILLLFEGTNLSESHVKKLIQSSKIEIDSIMMLIDNLFLWITFQLKEKKMLNNYISLEEVTAETLSLFRKQAEQKGVKLSMQIPCDVEVYGDLESIKIILRNLVNNAIKFSQRGDSVSVISEYDVSVEQVKIRIIDTGTGMSESEIDRIFENIGYSQEGTDHEKGTGIGLQLCFQYTVLNNSQLFIKSSLNKGTEFWFNLKGRMISHIL